MIRALITDFGGVLVRTASASPRRALEARLGLPPHTIEDRVFGGDASLRGQRGEMSFAAVWEQIGRDLELNGRMDIQEFRDLFFSADFLDVELMAFIHSLRPALKTGLLSNAWDNARQVFTQIFPIADAFDAIVISAEEKVAKPDPRIYRIALERLGVQAGESVFLDDMPENVRGAEAVGMRAVQFRSTVQAMREIGQLLGLGG